MSPAAAIERGEVVAGLDLRQSLDAEDLHAAARYRRHARGPSSMGPPVGQHGAMAINVSELFDADAWRRRRRASTSPTSRTTGRVDQGTVRIAFDRPEVRNAFRPHTVDELYTALDHARMSTDVGCVLLTGNGPSPKDGGWAFCSGGDQRIRGTRRLQVRRGRDRRRGIEPGAGRTAAHPRGASG